VSHEASETSTATATDAELGGVLRQYMDVAKRLQQTHAALQHEVARLRQELESKDRELELRRRLAALGELAAGVAHEVRNPLGAIRLYSDLLRDKCRELQAAPALPLIEKIAAGIAAIDAVVADTLALAPRGRQRAVCDLRRTVAQAQDASLRALTLGQVTLETEFTDDDPRVRADEAGLQRVLVNLMVNAAEASPPGSTVRVSVRPGPAQDVEVCVIDQGPGLPDEVRHRIFEPFFTTKPQGTGLGLTIAHRLVEAYGGRLTAANRAGGGAVFTVSLPRAATNRGDESNEADARQSSAA
jgi:signal transduction histidine kinase